MIAQHGKISDLWTQKRALSREILGDSLLHREATPDLSEDRTRVDLMFYQGKLGVRGPVKGNGDWDFDFTENFTTEFLNPKLVRFIKEFPTALVTKQFEAAQFRFRFDSKNKFGLWIDSKRESVEGFAKTSECLELQKICLLELGQRGDLVTPNSHVWLPSFSKSNDEIPLHSYVASFSQPGPEANRALIALGMELLEGLEGECKNWLEIGAGYGNLTAAYSSLLGAPRWILEKEKRDSSLWEKNKQYFGQTSAIQFHTKAAESYKEIEECDLLIADPPRSGFSEFFGKDLLKANRILLMSCDLKGLLKDYQALNEHYELRKWSLVDLFPGTSYAEAISLWQRK